MDQNTTPAQNPLTTPSQMPPQLHQEKRIGPIVGVLIIVLVLILGALYFFSQRLDTTPVVEDQASVQTSESNSNMTASAAEADDVTSLQTDLEAEMKDVDYSF